MHSSSTGSTVVSVIHEVDRRRFLLTAPVYRGMDIDPLTMDIFPRQTFPWHSRATGYDKKCCDGLDACTPINRLYAHTHNTHTFNGPFSGTTQVSRYEKGKTNLDFTEARDSEWQWHPLGQMQVCTSLQSDNHTSTPPLSFLQAGCPSCRPTNSVKALKALTYTYQ